MGSAGTIPGSGFSLRNDSLDGGLKFRAGGVDADLGGSFTENDTGLQDKVVFSSALARAVSGNLSFSGSPVEWLTLKAAAEGGLDSLTLVGTAPESSNGLRVSPSFSALARFGAVGFGLESRYWYRDDAYLGFGESQVHRLKIAAVFSLDLPATLIFQASGGWFVNSEGLSLFPFFASITGHAAGFPYHLAGGRIQGRPL